MLTSSLLSLMASRIYMSRRLQWPQAKTNFRGVEGTSPGVGKTRWYKSHRKWHSRVCVELAYQFVCGAFPQPVKISILHKPTHTHTHKQPQKQMEPAFSKPSAGTEEVLSGSKIYPGRNWITHNTTAVWLTLLSHAYLKPFISNKHVSPVHMALDLTSPTYFQYDVCNAWRVNHRSIKWMCVLQVHFIKILWITTWNSAVSTCTFGWLILEIFWSDSFSHPHLILLRSVDISSKLPFIWSSVSVENGHLKRRWNDIIGSSGFELVCLFPVH